MVLIERKRESDTVVNHSVVNGWGMKDLCE